MATKRQAPDEREPRQQPWKRRKPNNEHSNRPNHGKKSFKKAHPVNELKATVRSVRRLLERDNLPANIRVEKERELQTAQRDLERAQQAKQRSEMIGKYHKARFFERQKAERRLKKAKRALDACDDEDKGEKLRLRKEVEDREVDVNYALNFPLDQHYVSLFPTKRKKEGDDEKEEEEEEKDGEGQERLGDPEMWELVKQCMRKGNLADLREGRLTGKAAVKKEESPSDSKPDSKSKKKENTRSAGKQGVQTVKVEKGEESDNESGGGFFE